MQPLPPLLMTNGAIACLHCIVTRWQSFTMGAEAGSRMAHCMAELFSTSHEAAGSCQYEVMGKPQEWGGCFQRGCAATVIIECACIAFQLSGHHCYFAGSVLGMHLQ